MLGMEEEKKKRWAKMPQGHPFHLRMLPFFSPPLPLKCRLHVSHLVHRELGGVALGAYAGLL